MYNEFQDIENQANRFEDEQNIQNEINEGNVDEETASKLNDISLLRSNLDIAWKFHPDNMNKIDVVLYCEVLNDQIAVLEKELGIK